MNSLRILSTSVSILLTVSSAQAASVDEVRQSNAASIQKVKTGMVAYAVDRSFPPASSDDVAIATKAYKSHPEQLENSLTVNKLNRAARRESVKVWFRNTAGEWKSESKDVRDLDSMMARENLLPRQRAVLDTSNTILEAQGIRLTLFPPTRNVLLNEIPKGEPAILTAPVQFGLLQDSLFQNATRSSIADCSLNGRSLTCLTLESDENRYVAELDPSVGYQFRRLRLFSAKGGLVFEKTADDYRLIDGMHFPFRFESSTYDAKGALTKHEVVTVAQAEFNHDLPPNVLQVVLAPRTVVMGVTMGEVKSFKQERVLECDQLGALVQELHGTRRVTDKSSP